MKKVLFVCLGNICRSPTAQGIFDRYVKDMELSHLFESDSCGTSGWHIGDSPDIRATHHAANRGYELRNYRGRQIDFGDFYEFDLVLAMDETNYEDLHRIAPQEMSYKIKLILDYGTSGLKSVPDPYYGGDKGFEMVLDLLEDAVKELIEEEK